MNNMLLKIFIRLQGLRFNEEGQDLVEYALLLSLICLSLITGINGIAKAVNNVFSNISGSLA
jgi:pilus assembly protein Flp/PilA